MKALEQDTMSARDRVVGTIAGNQVDRVPIFDMIHHRELCEFITGEKLTLENGFDLLCKTISQCLDMTRGVSAPGEDRAWQDVEGFRYQSEWWTVWLVERPFQDVAGYLEHLRRAIDLVRGLPPETMYSFYGPGDVRMDKDVDQNEEYRKLQAKLENVVLMPRESPVGLDIAYHRAGLETFVYAYAENPELVSEWLEVLNQHEIKRAHKYADAKLAPVTLVYSDLASKTGPTFSPDFLRREFFPRLKRLVEAWHSHGVQVIYHSDGDYRMLLDDYAAAGVDGINPLEKIEDADYVQEVRDRWPQFTMMGGIDCSNLLPYGTPEQVEAEVKRTLDITRDGGRYILGSTTELHPACNVQNIQTMWDTALAYGREHRLHT